MLGGLVLGSLWSLYVAVAYLSDGLAARRLAPLPPTDATFTALMDDLYVRGVIERSERDGLRSRDAEWRQEWLERARQASLASAPRRHGRFLIVFGTIGCLLALVAVSIFFLSLLFCYGSSDCWRQARSVEYSVSLLAPMPLLGGFASGLGLASLFSGALLLRRAQTSEVEAEAALKEIADRVARGRDDILDLARVRVAEGGRAGRPLP